MRLNRTRRSVREDDGWILVVAMGVMALILALGLATLAVVDSQAKQSRSDRVGDSSYNLADSVTQSAAFLLGTKWHDNAASTRAGTTAACGDASQEYSGYLDGADATDAFSTQVRSLIARSYSATGDYATTTARRARWTLSVCAVDPAHPTERWNDAILARAAYSPAATTTAAQPRLWVRAQTVVGGVRRTVAAQVQANSQPSTLPTKFAVVTGSFGDELSATTGTALSSTTLGPVLSALGQKGQLFRDADKGASPDGYQFGVRCVLLNLLNTGKLCLTGTLAGVTNATSTLAGTGPLTGALGLNTSVQFPTWTSASPAQINAYRKAAQAAGTYVQTLAAGAGCMSQLPAGYNPDSPSYAAAPVFVEQVGNGDQSCVLDGTGQTRAPALMIGSGRVLVQNGVNGVPGTAATATAPTFTGVLYALNNQRTSNGTTDRIVTIQKGGRVRGAVFVDGGGQLEVDPPAYSTNTLLDSLKTTICSQANKSVFVNLQILAGPLQAILGGLVSVLLQPTCDQLIDALKTLGVSSLLDTLTSTLGADAVAAALVPQLQNYTAVERDVPAIQKATATVIQNAGTVAGSFQLAPATCRSAASPSVWEACPAAP